MTDEQILKRVIKKAISGGWEMRRCVDFRVKTPIARKLEEALGVKFPRLAEVYLITPQSKGGHEVEIDIYNLIFSHDFAKAFFGEELTSSLSKPRQRVWQYHLQQMVLEENPLKYLERFLGEEKK